MLRIDQILKTLNNDVIVSACDKVAGICKPLQKFGIENFHYVVNFHNRRRIHLVTDFFQSVDFYENFYALHYAENILLEMNLTNKKMHLYSELHKSKNQVEVDVNQKFQVENAIALFEKANNYNEIVYFTSSQKTTQMLNFYINNIELLQRFKFYFKEQAKELIKLAYDSNLTIPAQYYPKLKENFLIKDQDYSLDLNIKKYLLNADCSQHFLSNKEVDCIHWCALGKTAEETAIILGVTKKTIEAHLENAKKKLNCVNKQQLVYKAMHMNLINEI